MSHIARPLLVAVAFLSVPATRAAACGGPCDTPDLWSVLDLGETPLVVTNFGLLSSDGSGWNLTCEETIGDIVLDVKSNGAHLVASTETGLFISTASVCGFIPGPRSSASTWFLDLAIAADSTADAPRLLGLVSDPVASAINLELAEGGNFERLHSFGTSTAYRSIEASPDFATIVVSGYTSQPRRWQLAWSTTAGQTWEEYAPEVDLPNASLALLAMNPAKPARVFFQLHGTTEYPSELWEFDRESNTTTRLWIAPDGDAITGLAFLDHHLWLATRGASSGNLYRASLDELDAVEKVLSAPPLLCLGVIDRKLLTCSGDFSAQSPFLLANVNVAEPAFEPLLTVTDLGSIRECGPECSETSEWLTSLYGSVRESEGGVDEPTSDPDQGTTSAAPADAKSSGGCRLGLPGPTHPWIWALIGLTLFIFRSRRVV